MAKRIDVGGGLGAWALLALAGTASWAAPASWTGADIGSPGAAGSHVEQDGVLAVQGAGRYAAHDPKSHFVYLPMSGLGTGDGSLVVRITAQQNPHWAAVSGIAIREGLATNASYVHLQRNVGGSVKLYRYQGWGMGEETAGGPPLPCWLKLERQGNTFKGAYSANGTDWTPAPPAEGYTLQMPKDVYIGLIVSSGVDGVLNQLVYDNISTEGTDRLAPGWASVDLGAASPVGSAAQNAVLDDTFTVTGGGAGFYGAADSGHFVYREVSGDHEIVARVVGRQGGADAAAPVALMIRDSLAAGSRNAVLAISADRVLRFQSHPAAGDPRSAVATSRGPAPPCWLRLVRTGGTVSGYHSQDGWNWSLAGSAAVPLNATAYLGMAVSSHQNGQTQTGVFERVVVQASRPLPPATVPVMTDILAAPGVTLIDEIDTAATAPVYQSAAGVHEVRNILGRNARVLPTRDAQGQVLGAAATAATIAYVVGQGKGLTPGNAYILAVEYPEDAARAMYLVNRGADLHRGLATGRAVGDARSQYVEPSVESLGYPLSGTWQTHKQFFFLLDRFQGVAGNRVPLMGYRPRAPQDGFHVVISRMKHLNDPRSEGAAVGRIRLYAVSDPAALYAPIHYPPANLPRRSIFWREEMGDQILTYPEDAPWNNPTGNPEDRAVSDPLHWYVHKMRMAKVLGVNTYTKDLLEFGYNQGWITGDPGWMSEGQDPVRDIWTRLVPKATEEGLALMPYYEYKAGIGVWNDSLSNERRAHKLYHGLRNACSGPENTSAWYQCIHWTEPSNADVTDPDTLADAKRVLDRTVGDFKSRGAFQGIWFRMRGNHLPMSFAAAAIARFKADRPGDSLAQTASQAALIASYEETYAQDPTPKKLYRDYVEWWFLKRRQFLVALRDYLRTAHGIEDAQVLFTPWTNEALPPLHHLGTPFGHAGVVVDDADYDWWHNFHVGLPVSSTKYQWQPTRFSQVLPQGDDLYRYVLEEQTPINHPAAWGNGGTESFHAAPNADPLNYQHLDGVMMTFPIGRLFSVADESLFQDYRCADGLAVVRHFTLNEDNGGSGGGPSPFDGQLGYLSVDCDRAGHHMMLPQARSLAKGDPRHIGYLAASSFSTGFPEVMRRFNQAFLAVPALPSILQPAASSNSSVVVRKIPTTTGQGTYYYVVNTSMAPAAATVTLDAAGAVTELVTGQALPGPVLNLTLDSAELRSYRVGGAEERSFRDQWLANSFSPAQLQASTISGMTADPDADGLPNLLEYALGADPLQPDAAPPANIDAGPGEPAGLLAFAYRRPAGVDDVAYNVESSVDLRQWDSMGPGAKVSEANGIEFWRLQTPFEGPRRFMRLRITEQP